MQCTGADGLKAALGLLRERRAHAPGAFPVLTGHDESSSVTRGQAVAVVPWLKAAMLDAMAPLWAPVPVEVEVQVAPTWGG